MPNIKERLKNKLIVNQMYSKLHSAEVREKLCKELYIEAVEKRLLNEEQDYIYDGQRIPFPAFVVEMLFQILQKNKNIQNIQVNMRDGKTIHTEIDHEHVINPWEDEN